MVTESTWTPPGNVTEMQILETPIPCLLSLKLQKSLRRIWIPIFSSVDKNDELPRIFFMTKKKTLKSQNHKIILYKRVHPDQLPL